MKLLSCYFLLLLNFFVFNTLYAAPQSISIYVSNDVHGEVQLRVQDIEGQKMNVGSLPTFYTILKKAKADGEKMLYIDVGDKFQGHPYCNLSDGFIMTDMYNKFAELFGPNITSVLGNHDIDYSKRILISNQLASQVPLLSANIGLNPEYNDPNDNDQKYTEKLLELIKPYTIHEINYGDANTPKIFRVGVIGLTTGSTADYGYGLSLKFENAIGSLNKYLPEMFEKGIDLLVIASHLGLDDDQRLADKYTVKQPSGKNIKTLILGAHTHAVLKEPYTGKTGILMSQSGAYGKFGGKWKINFNDENNSVDSMKYNIFPLNADENKPSKELTEVLESWKEKLNDKYKLEEVLGETSIVLYLSKNIGENSLGDFLMDGVLKVANAMIKKENSGGEDISYANAAFYNNTGIRYFQLGDPNEPKIKRLDLFRIFPIDNPMLSIEISGHKINWALQKGIERRWFLSNSGLKYNVANVWKKKKRATPPAWSNLSINNIKVNLMLDDMDLFTLESWAKPVADNEKIAVKFLKNNKMSSLLPKIDSLELSNNNLVVWNDVTKPVNYDNCDLISSTAYDIEIWNEEAKKFEPIDSEKKYHVIMPDYLYGMDLFPFGKYGKLIKDWKYPGKYYLEKHVKSVKKISPETIRPKDFIKVFNYVVPENGTPEDDPAWRAITNSDFNSFEKLRNTDPQTKKNIKENPLF